MEDPEPSEPDPVDCSVHHSVHHSADQSADHSTEHTADHSVDQATDHETDQSLVSNEDETSAQNSSLQSDKHSENGVWDRALKTRRSRTPQKPSSNGSTINTKEKIQAAVDLFSALDSVEKACFFHCIIPSIKGADLENLKFSINLTRTAKKTKVLNRTTQTEETETEVDTSPAKSPKKVTKSAKKGRKTPKKRTPVKQTVTPTRKSTRRRVIPKKYAKEVSDQEASDKDEQTEEVQKVIEPVKIRFKDKKRKAAQTQNDDEFDTTPAKKPRKSSKTPVKEASDSDDEVDDDNKPLDDDNKPLGDTKSPEPVGRASRLRQRAEISFTLDDLSEEYDICEEVEDDDDDYDPLEDEPKKTSPKKLVPLITTNEATDEEDEDDIELPAPVTIIKPQKVAKKSASNGIDSSKDHKKKSPRRRQQKPRETSDKICSSICKQCGKYEKTEVQLALHIAMQHLKKPFSCSICSMKFLNKASLQGHEILHKESNLQCGTCDVAFSTTYELRFHQSQKHKKPQLMKCPVCPRNFMHFRNLQRHVKQHTDRGKKANENIRLVIEQDPEGDASTIVAKLVGGAVEGGGGEGEGVKSSPKEGLLRYQCDLCGASFAYKSGLWKHQKTHTGTRNYQCELCGKAFMDRYTLTAHERTHTGERPFICEICGARFTQRGNLYKHNYLKHTNIPSHKLVMCDSCPKTFKDPHSLKRHYLIHSGEKNFVCKFCQRRFARTKELNVHERTHTGERPFRCKTCEKTFTDRSNLKVHEKTHTAGDRCPTCSQLFRNVREFRKHKKVCGLVGDGRAEDASAVVELEVSTLTEETTYVENLSTTGDQTHSSVELHSSVYHPSVQDSIEIVTSAGNIVPGNNVTLGSNIVPGGYGAHNIVVTESASTLNQQAVNTILNLSTNQYYYQM